MSLSKKYSFIIVTVLLLVIILILSSVIIYKPSHEITTVSTSYTTLTSIELITSTITRITTLVITEVTTSYIEGHLYDIIADRLNITRETLNIIYLKETGLDKIYAILIMDVDRLRSIGILYDGRLNLIKEVSFDYSPKSEIETTIFNSFINKCRCPYPQCASVICLPSKIHYFNQTHYKVEYYDGWSTIGKHWSIGLALLNIVTGEIIHIEHTK